MSDHDFNTPPWILDLVRKLDPKGVIGLDPCSNSYSMVKAKTAYIIVENGLIQPWRGHGLVFVNPPHSTSPNNIEPWMDKAKAEFIDQPFDWHDSTNDSLVCLIPAKPDTAWFHDVAAHFSARCFLRGRPKYWHRGSETAGPGKFAVMITYHGKSTGQFMNIFSDYGWIA